MNIDKESDCFFASVGKKGYVYLNSSFTKCSMKVQSCHKC
jgi:hypothetical protein